MSDGSPTDPTAPEPPPEADPTDPATMRLLDELAANATVAPVTRLVDGWLCKYGPDLPFRRANAVSPAFGAGDDHAGAAEALAEVEAWYRTRGRRVLVQVSSADPTSAALDAQLERRGYQVEAPVDLLVAAGPVAQAAGARSSDGLRVSLEERAGADVVPPTVVTEVGVDPGWAGRHRSVHAGDEGWRIRSVALSAMLAQLGTSGLAAAATSAEAVTVGIGFAVVERGWAGIFGMGSHPWWRRRGVAGALVGSLAVVARAQGAAHLYLQAEVGNEAAQSLYRGLGFVRSHGYHYRVLDPS